MFHVSRNARKGKHREGVGRRGLAIGAAFAVRAAMALTASVLVHGGGTRLQEKRKGLLRIGGEAQREVRPVEGPSCPAYQRRLKIGLGGLVSAIASTEPLDRGVGEEAAHSA